MADEPMAIAPLPEQETAIPQTVETTPAAPLDEPERIPGPFEATEAAALLQQTEEEDFEWQHTDGKTYRLPAAVRKNLMLDKDYTQSKQKLAEERKVFDTERSRLEESRKVSDDELNDRVLMRSIDTTLGDYAKLTAADWDAHSAQDPLGTEQHWRRYQLLKEQRGEVQSRIDSAGKTRTETAQQEFAKRVQETLDAAPTIIPGWKTETGEQTLTGILKFAHSEGIPEQVLQANWGPTLLKLLHRAQLGDQLLKSRTAAPKPATAEPLAPLQVVGGGKSAPARVDLASADMESYVAARKRGVGGKALG